MYLTNLGIKLSGVKLPLVLNVDVCLSFVNVYLQPTKTAIPAVVVINSMEISKMDFEPSKSRERHSEQLSKF